MGSVGDQDRTYPLKRPKGHKVPVSRWNLQFPDDITHIYTLYIGVQTHNDNKKLASKAEEVVSDILSQNKATAPIVDTFRITGGNDLLESRLWVAYWTDVEGFETKLGQFDLQSIWNNLGDGKDGVGIWIEHFTTPITRLETNYSRLDHKPGLAQLPRTTQPQHEVTAYWGAGRDRIPASAHDLFEQPKPLNPPSSAPSGIGQRLTGQNYDNMCHIRSGQWWAECTDEERSAYEDDLQITLMEGMRYLWEHPEETGTIGLRFAQNLGGSDGKELLIRETCAAGFHRNWADLERWSSRHPSHLAIFNGSMRHAKRFGEGRKLMTWHEVSILKAGEAGFEYVNCAPETGVIKWVEMDVEKL